VFFVTVTNSYNVAVRARNERFFVLPFNVAHDVSTQVSSASDRAFRSCSLEGSVVAWKPQRGHKGFDPAPVTENGRKVDLHLLARWRLKAHYRIRFGGFEVGNVVLDLADPAGIAAILNLS